MSPARSAAPTDLIERGHAVCVGGGVGTAVILPIAQELDRRGVKVTSVIGGRSREWVILEDELRRGGRGRDLHRRRQLRPPGLRDPGAGGRARRPAASTPSTRSGPVPMMRAVSELTRPFGVPTLVSLNAIMVDGTGMCGGCRVSVGGKTRYACVDGPEFDAHAVDFARARRPADHLSRPSNKAALEQREALPASPALAAALVRA